MDHGRFKPAYGYILQQNNDIVGFTGDTCYCSNVEYMASICKYLMCDCSLIVGNNKHMGIDNILLLANKYKNCKFVVSHMSYDTKEQIAKLNIDNIILLEDGDEIKK